MQNLINNNMNRYFMYLRKSRKDEEAEAHGEGETLARHEHILTELYKRMGISGEQVDIFKEIVSGETISARPVIQQVLDLVNNGIYEGGFVYEVERLARGDTIDQGIIAQTFKYSSTKIITPNKIYDPGNEFDEEYFEFGLFMSRREYKTINRRLQNGRTASANEGKYPGSKAPFGYKRIKLQNQKGFSLEIVPEQAEIVKLIYEMYCNGHIPRDIASTLDNMNIKPVNGGNNGHWSEHSLRDILSNPIYLGKIRWKDRKVVKKVKDGRLVSTQPKNKNDTILVDGLHNAIITEEQFNKAEQIRKNNCFSPLPSCYNMQNPLSGVVYCSKCGRSMRRVLSKGKELLACTNPNCNNISSDLDIVEQKLFKIITSMLITYEEEEKYKNIKLNGDNNEDLIKVKQQELNNIKNEIEQAETQLDNIQTLLEKGVYDLDTYSTRSKKVLDLLNDLKTKYINTNTSISNLINKTSSKRNLIPKLKAFLDEYDEVGIQDKNKLLKTILLKVNYLKETKCYGKNVNKDNFKLTIYPKF